MLKLGIVLVAATLSLQSFSNNPNSGFSGSYDNVIVQNASDKAVKMIADNEIKPSDEALSFSVDVKGQDKPMADRLGISQDSSVVYLKFSAEKPRKIRSITIETGSSFDSIDCREQCDDPKQIVEFTLAALKDFSMTATVEFEDFTTRVYKQNVVLNKKK